MTSWGSGSWWWTCQPSAKICVPGRTCRAVMGSKVAAEWSGTATIMHKFVSHSTIPRTQWPSWKWPWWYSQCMNLLSSTLTVRPARSTYLHRMIQQVSTVNVADVLLPFNHGYLRHPSLHTSICLFDLSRPSADTINQLHQWQMRAFKKESAVTLFWQLHIRHNQAKSSTKSAPLWDCNDIRMSQLPQWTSLWMSPCWADQQSTLSESPHSWWRSRMLTSNGGKSAAGNTISTVELRVRERSSSHAAIWLLVLKLCGDLHMNNCGGPVCFDWGVIFDKWLIHTWLHAWH